MTLDDPINGSDYINASWITDGTNNVSPGIQASTHFIASQGPMLHTCPHHLQMLYKNSVDIIVMLTKSGADNSGAKSTCE